MVRNMNDIYGSLANTQGGLPVVPTSVGIAQSRNREISALSTRETVTWATGVNEVTVTVIQEAAGTAELRASAAIAFDAPNDAVADAWLTHADSTAVDSLMYVIPAGESRTFYFSGAGITRLDAKRLYGSEALGVIVEAA